MAASYPSSYMIPNSVTSSEIQIVAPALLQLNRGEVTSSGELQNTAAVQSCTSPACSAPVSTFDDCLECQKHASLNLKCDACWTDCASPCNEAECDIPQACFDEHCAAEICADSCEDTKCATQECSDVTCSETVHCNATCFDTNCLYTFGDSTGPINSTTSLSFHPHECGQSHCFGFLPIGPGLGNLGHANGHDMLHGCPQMAGNNHEASWHADGSEHDHNHFDHRHKRMRVESSHLPNYPHASFDNTQSYQTPYWNSCDFNSLQLNSFFPESCFTFPNHQHNSECYDFFHTNLDSLNIPGYSGGDTMNIKQSDMNAFDATQHPQYNMIPMSNQDSSSALTFAPQAEMLSSRTSTDVRPALAQLPNLKHSIAPSPRIHSQLLECTDHDDDTLHVCKWVEGDAPCGQSFACSKDLDEHLQKLHTKSLGPQSFTCSWESCNTEFKHRGKLNRHISGAHSRYHAYTCSHIDLLTKEPCGRTFCTKEQLKNHETVHTGERRYKCRFCDHTSATKTQHNTHERIHTKEKPYLCPWCGHRSGDSSNLSKHVRNKHPGMAGRGKREQPESGTFVVEASTAA